MSSRKTQPDEVSFGQRYLKLTPEELRLLMLITALAILGLTARYLHLRGP